VLTARELKRLCHADRVFRMLALWSAPAGMVLGSAVLALGVTLSTPAFFSAIVATASPGELGAASGTASLFLDLGMGGGPMLLGLVAQAGGIPFAFGVAAAVALAGCGWILALFRMSRGSGVPAG
jgi:predicted MFS family arabinose efflux permease